MPIVYLAPDPVQSTFLIPGGNTPGNGVQLFCYVAGSVSTKQNMYTDNTGTSTHSNPLVLDSGGNIPNGGTIWIPQSLPAKFVWAPSNDTDPPTSPYRTIDNVSGINDVTSQEWVTGPTPTFVNASSFTMAGDQTGTFKPSRRMKFAVTAGTVYGAVGLAAFGTSTTINTVFASGALDAGLTAVSYSLIDPSTTSSLGADYVHKKATSVPSAGNGTTNIWGVDGDFLHITGTNTIAHFSTAPYAGAERTVIFDGILSINTSAALSLAGGNATTAANDCATIRADTTSTAIITFYEKANGRALATSVPFWTRITFTSGSGTWFTSSLAQTPVALDVQLIGGGGGGASSNGDNGKAGTSTTFSSSGLSLIGGGGGSGIANGGGVGTAGSASGGTTNIPGGIGQSGVNPGAGGTLGGGSGGQGFFGGGAGGPGANQAGDNGATNSGGGGSGGGATTNAAASGGGGGSGGYVRRLITSVNSSYAYSVGPGGGAGTTSGQTGGTGGSGLIMIDAYYF